MRKWQRTAGAIIGVAMVIATASMVTAAEADQVSGSTVGGGPCDSPPAGFGTVDYVIPVAGDLAGCIYGHITLSRAHPGGTYQEVADEIFVGSWGDLEGTFQLQENYTAKFGADTPAGFFFGRCKHPIVTGSGTDDFEGVSGRLDFKDDPATGTAAYTGHLRFG
jgi:hypothetical protein